jgi:hypothetical protein
MRMDPITLIVTALATGAAQGMTDAASSAVKGADARLKGLAKKRLTGRKDGELVLARHGESPDSWEGLLSAVLPRRGQTPMLIL